MSFTYTVVGACALETVLRMRQIFGTKGSRELLRAKESQLELPCRECPSSRQQSAASVRGAGYDFPAGKAIISPTSSNLAYLCVAHGLG